MLPTRSVRSVHAAFALRAYSLAVLLCLLLLSGCGPLLIRDVDRNTYVPARTGTLVLHKELPLRGGHTRVYLQGGAVVAGVNEFLPHCQFEVNTLLDTPRTIAPDTFTITRISTRTDQVVQTAPLQLAVVGRYWPLHSDRFDGGELRRMYVYLFFLHSARQPDVRMLICGGAFDTPGLAERPTLQEIAESLGIYATLTLQ